MDLAQWGPLPDRRQISEASLTTLLLYGGVSLPDKMCCRFQVMYMCVYVHGTPFVHPGSAARQCRYVVASTPLVPCRSR